MPKIRYRTLRFSDDRLAIIDIANSIIAEYQDKGFKLTLRQLYYQFVGRNLFPASWAHPVTGITNRQENYDKLGDVIARGRLAGLVDWHAIEDRTRELSKINRWESPADIMQAAAAGYRIDKWADQKHRVEVWVEKDALEGVIEHAAHPLDVDVFSCRGYASLTSLWEASQRLRGYIERGQRVTVLHVGDHDPSGIDMSRDIDEKLNHFLWNDYALQHVIPDAETNGDLDELKDKHVLSDRLLQRITDDCGDDRITVERIALTMEQIEQYNPPPNPAKEADARFKNYEKKFGNESWELDALPAEVLADIVSDAILRVRDDEKYKAREEIEQRERTLLRKAGANWHKGVATFIEQFNEQKTGAVSPAKKPNPRTTRSKKGKKR